MKIHVLAGNNDSRYRLVVHFLMPSGNNSTNVPWKDAYLASKRTQFEGTWAGVDSVLEGGTDVGQITVTERTLIQAGDVVEIVVAVPAGEGTPAALNELAEAAITTAKTDLAASLKFYGHTQGTVT